jgi:hypothetical protein
MPNTNGHHINVLKHFVHVSYGCGTQFEVAFSLNHDVSTAAEIKLVRSKDLLVALHCCEY